MQVRELLQAAAIAPEEAQLLLAWVLDKDRGWLYAWSDAEVSSEQAAQFQTLCAQRAAGQPIAYLIGQREFWSLPLKVTPATLIPRPETEHLVEQALAAQPANKVCRVLDMGTGSGAVALAIASEQPNWQISACERSIEALATARENAKNLQLAVNFVESDWFSAISTTFDLIVSNPPYIPDNDPHLAQGDLRFEPSSALAAGNDGLDDIRLLITQAPQHLAPEGQLLLEHGYDQAAQVRALMNAAGYREVRSVQDLAGHERITQGKTPT